MTHDLKLTFTCLCIQIYCYVICIYLYVIIHFLNFNQPKIMHNIIITGANMNDLTLYVEIRQRLGYVTQTSLKYAVQNNTRVTRYHNRNHMKQ